MGTMGRQHGETNEITPATKARNGSIRLIAASSFALDGVGRGWRPRWSNLKSDPYMLSQRDYAQVAPVPTAIDVGADRMNCICPQGGGPCPAQRLMPDVEELPQRKSAL